MKTSDLVVLFCDGTLLDDKGYENVNEIYKRKVEHACQQLNNTFECIFKNLNPIHKNLHFINEFYENPEWKLIATSIYLLSLINKELETKEEELLSVQECKNLRKHLNILSHIGIYTKLLPKLPFAIKTNENNPNDTFLNYNILKWTTSALHFLLKSPNLRIIILPEGLRAILLSLYQISYCPLKRPSTETPASQSTQFIMTQERYDKLLEEREHFRNLLHNLQSSIHVELFVKETMIIFQSTAPVWLKKAVSQTLTNILRTRNGLENIVITLLDGADNDSTTTWRIFNIIAKLVGSSRNLPDFQENIVSQLANLPAKGLLLDDKNLVYERLFSCCTKSLYTVDENLTKESLLRPIIGYFLYFTYSNTNLQDGDILTPKIAQNTRLLHGLFVDNSGEHPSLPIIHLTPIVGVLFRFYSLTVNATPLDTLNRGLGDILINFLKSSEHDLFKLFDYFLYGFTIPHLVPLRTDVSMDIEKTDIVLHKSAFTVTYRTGENGDAVMQLLKDDKALQVRFFAYLLMCLTKKSTYFPSNVDDLLCVETDFMNGHFERSLTVYKLLSTLSDDKSIQKEITNHPEDIIQYIQGVLVNDADENDPQTLFIVIMILEAFVANGNRCEMGKFECLIDPLVKLTVNSANKELTSLVERILARLRSEESGKTTVQEESALDKAIEDVCDPLLPVRGHGLMTLKKLVENRDGSVMDRKQYVLNIFQQNLKHDDTFIYLNAIGGLSAMAFSFPDIVLEVLCEEFLENRHSDGHEVRIKVGEVLVCTTKTLGDMAPKYKPLLLNTFLNGAKDDDELMRASSLANLGEICRILGYKLGTIVTEILVCVHAVIATDKSVEARRAAVTVVRQLFVGLDSEMIAFLKDDILPIYRTLKQIYNCDKDDVMRLQAQLALEELNENMKKFVFPQVQLHANKKFVVLNDGNKDV